MTVAHEAHGDADGRVPLGADGADRVLVHADDLGGGHYVTPVVRAAVREKATGEIGRPDEDRGDVRVLLDREQSPVDDDVRGTVPTEEIDRNGDAFAGHLTTAGAWLRRG